MSGGGTHSSLRKTLGALKHTTTDAMHEIGAQLQGRPDLIIGNYSDRSLVASLSSYKLGVTQVGLEPGWTDGSSGGGGTTAAVARRRAARSDAPPELHSPVSIVEESPKMGV